MHLIGQLFCSLGISAIEMNFGFNTFQDFSSLLDEFHHSFKPILKVELIHGFDFPTCICNNNLFTIVKWDN